MARQDNHGRMVKKDGDGAPTIYEAFTVHGEDASFNWGDVDSALLARTIDAVTARGHAISFSRSRPGTAGSITILAGAARPHWWVDTEAEAEALLIKLLNAQ